MGKNSGPAKSSPRVLPREQRREQLIAATIHSISRNGLSGTTMATITKEAGLSLGIANLHFKTKDKLLVATLEKVTNEFNQGQAAILSPSNEVGLSQKLHAMVEFNLSPRLTQRNKLAVWFAFWGEARFRPTYQRICNKVDLNSQREISRLFEEIIAEGAYTDISAELLACGYTALLDGLWLDLLVTPGTRTRDAARRVLLDYLARAFPNHIETS